MAASEDLPSKAKLWRGPSGSASIFRAVGNREIRPSKSEIFGSLMLLLILFCCSVFVFHNETYKFSQRFQGLVFAVALRPHLGTMSSSTSVEGSGVLQLDVNPVAAPPLAISFSKVFVCLSLS